MVFEKIWRDPDTHINKGRQWNAFSDQLSADDMNYIVSNLNFVKDRIVEGQGTIIYLDGKPLMVLDASDFMVKETADKIYSTKEEVSELETNTSNRLGALGEEVSELETNTNNRLETLENETKYTGMTADLIFDTSTRTTGTYSFLKDISQYTLIVFCGYETVGNTNTYVTTTVDAFKRTDSTYQMQIANNSVDKNRYMKLYYKSDTSFIITAFGNFNFRRVYGIK